MATQQGVQYEVPDDLFGPSGVTVEPHSNAPLQPQAVKNVVWRHPVCTFFHIFWRAAALLVYLFGGFFGANSFVAIFITCIVLLAFDFWTVKNITGRLMVGLRWWNEIKEDGSSEWIFESIEDQSLISSTEKTIFWAALFLAPLFWLLFALFSLLGVSPTWLVVNCVALALNMANVVGYVKCAKGNNSFNFVYNPKDRNNIGKMAQNYFTSTIIKRATQSATSSVQL